MHDELAQFLLIAAFTAAGLVILVPLGVYLVHRLFFFDWPPLYEWEQARRQLRLGDRWRVIWATYRHHPASRAALAGAQVAHARYRQAAAQRGLNRQRPGRRAVGMVYCGVLAAVWAALAAAYSQQRILYSVQAACFAGLALVSGLDLDRRTARRQAELMARLQAEIENRYPRSRDAPPRQRQEPGLPHSA